MCCLGVCCVHTYGFHCVTSRLFVATEGDFRLSVEDLQRIPALHCGDRSDLWRMHVYVLSDADHASITYLTLL